MYDPARDQYKEVYQRETNDGEHRLKRGIDQVAKHSKVDAEALPSAPRSPPRKLKRPTTRTEKVEPKKDVPIAEVSKIPVAVRSTQEAVRQHYDERPDQGVFAREQSQLVNLRKYNNFIKSILIQKFGVPEHVAQRGRRDRPRVLDMGCGKGGDLQKWDKLRPEIYLAVDISGKSLEQARERYDQVQNRKRRQRRMHEMWRADFYTLDCYSLPLITVVSQDTFPVDVVTMQFCMHYAFESEEKARMMLSNVSKSLSRNGVFLGTIPSSDAILERIEKALRLGEKEFGNSAYSIRFAEDPPRDGAFRPIYGHKYTFFMQDAVEDVPEYVVPFEGFRGLADEYGLELLFRKNFHEIYDTEVFSESGRRAGFPRLGEDMRVIDPDDGMRYISGDQWDAVGLYLGFAFYKR